ncbi:hypothetical protein NDU88_001286 [Pleurodeles waltl]|uniref:Uncharacterized protein n=1 Tax=Pleurodeles waltl TaxID=8319 RepID=A0AAV7MU84_PLEWA|nr:hypothetical protein NDU88_001286 [Pleurodeles waltl]
MENHGENQELNIEEIIKAAREAAATHSKDWILKQIRGNGASEVPTQEGHTGDRTSGGARDEEDPQSEAKKRQMNESRGAKKGDKKEAGELPEAGTPGPQEAEVPVKQAFLEHLFGVHREDLAALKQVMAADVKDIKKDFGELGQRVTALEQTGDSREEELEVHQWELLGLWDKNEELLYILENLENRSRHSNSQIKGVPHQAAAGRPEDYVLRLFRHVAPNLQNRKWHWTAHTEQTNQRDPLLRALAEQHARAHALVTWRRLYDVGDKADKLLAWLDGWDRERSWVRQVKSGDGTKCGTNELIAEAFAVYYEEVCASMTLMTEEDCADLFRDIPHPELSVEKRNELDAELTEEEEVTEALRGRQSGKAARTNGLRMELFKCMGSTVAKHMLTMFQEETERREFCCRISGQRLSY